MRRRGVATFFRLASVVFLPDRLRRRLPLVRLGFFPTLEAIEEVVFLPGRQGFAGRHPCMLVDELREDVAQVLLVERQVRRAGVFLQPTVRGRKSAPAGISAARLTSRHFGL